MEIFLKNLNLRKIKSTNNKAFTRTNLWKQICPAEGVIWLQSVDASELFSEGESFARFV